jgi:hypothetical protein
LVMNTDLLPTDNVKANCDDGLRSSALCKISLHSLKREFRTIEYERHLVTLSTCEKSENLLKKAVGHLPMVRI